MRLMRIRHVQIGRHGQFRRNTTPHEQLALLLARFGDWTKQSDLAEGRAEDILLTLGSGWLPNTEAVQVPFEQIRCNYQVLTYPCAHLCCGNVAREVMLIAPERIGRLVAYFVPAYVP